MKNKDSGSGESIFKKKGFFIALYSCLGSVMVLALVISFSNMTINDRNIASNPPAETGDTVKANTDTVKSYMDQAAAMEQAATMDQTTAMEQAAAMEEAWWRSTPKSTPTAIPLPTATPQPTAVPTPTATPVITAAPTNAPEPATPSITGTQTPPSSTSDSTTSDESSDGTVNETEDGYAFTPFTESDRMLWPVSGEIAMPYSIDRLVYDPTLDQYRTNDDIRITAQEGTPVKSGADGQVVEIDSNHVYGNYVVVDNGNGWTSIYGQLMDGILVQEGDVIKAGQVIGGVGKPSIYGVLNGSHVNLRVTKENEPVDPRTVLLDEQE